MSYSSRHRPSRRVYADTSDAGPATLDDCQEYLNAIHDEYGHYSRSAFSPHGIYASADHRGLRNYSSTSRKTTVTEYHTHTNGESPTAHHSYTEYTAYDSPQISPRLPEKRSQRLGIQSTYADRSERESSRHGAPKDRGHGTSNRHVDDTMPEARPSRRPQTSAKERSGRPSYAHAEQSQRKEPKPTPTDKYSSKSKSYSSHKHARFQDPVQSKPESGSHRDQEQPHSSRTQSRRGENPRSSGNDRTHENRDHGNHRHQRAPAKKAREELPDHYLTLGISPLASAEEIKTAAKRKRVEVHPDRLKKEGMDESELAKIDAVAAKVGQAAEVLQNAEQKRKYDQQRNAF